MNQKEMARSLNKIESEGARKGFVRDEILNLLSREPQTSTEIARNLKVAKSTVSYHVRRMIARGDIETIRVEHDKKGFTRKFYSLKNKGQFFVADSTHDEGYVKKIDSVFIDLKKSLNPKIDVPIGSAIRNTLLHMLRLIPKISRIKHDQIMYTYGHKIGFEILSQRISGETVGEVFRNNRDFWRRHQMGIVEIPSVRGAPKAIMVNNCFDCEISVDRGGLLCNFVHGILDGTIEAKFGPQYKFTNAKYQKPGTIFCEFSRRRI